MPDRLIESIGHGTPVGTEDRAACGYDHISARDRIIPSGALDRSNPA